MRELARGLANQPAVDFGDEAPYAFGYLPINAKLNAEIYARAVQRAKRSGDGQTAGEKE